MGKTSVLGKGPATGKPPAMCSISKLAVGKPAASNISLKRIRRFPLMMLATSEFMCTWSSASFSSSSLALFCQNLRAAHLRAAISSTVNYIL